MEQTGSIYIIKNKINDKVYIGQTTQSVHDRFMQHMKPSTTKSRGTYKFYNAVNKYGRENFYVETLETNIPIDQLDEKEIAYIKQYDSCDNGYNTTYGGNVRRIHEPWDIDNIIGLFKQGKSSFEIADIYGVNHITILRTIHGSGFYVHDDLNKSELKDLVEQGYTNQEIADMLGSKAWTVERYLSRYGIRRRKIYLCDREDFDWEGIKLDLENHIPRDVILEKYDITKGTLGRVKEKLKNMNNQKSVTTIPQGSTTDDELRLEVQSTS